MERSYYSIIPAEVRYDKELTANAKLLYGEITSLCNDKGYCWANNDYFATLYGVSKVSISKWVNQLIQKGYIFSEIIYKENSKEIQSRCIKLVDTPIKEMFNTPIKENFNTPIKEKFKDNNKIYNNKKENNKKKYFENEELNNLFNEYLELRLKLKAKNTDRAINLLLDKLNSYSDSDKLEMINNSIVNSWKSVYPLKNQKKEVKVPEWFNKEIRKEELTDEQKRMLQYVNGED